MKRIVHLFFICSFLYLGAQESIQNGSFELLTPCHEGTSTPKSWIFTSHSTAIQVQSHAPTACTPASILAAHDGDNYLAVGFTVNTSRVQPLFVQTLLRQPLKKDSLYTVSFFLRKDPSSLGSVREIQFVFGSGPITPDMNLSLRPHQQNAISCPVMNVSSHVWQPYQLTYRASGTEHYLVVGSIDQRFQLKQGMMNYGAERQGSTRSNAIYHIDNISILPAHTNTDWTLTPLNNNSINDLPYPSSNLIVNGSFENFQQQQRFTPDNILPGAAIAEGWYNLTNYGSAVLAYDNIRDFSTSRYVPFTGKAVAILDVLRTNEHHTYGQSWRTIRHENHTTIHRYENAPNMIPATYKRGGYLTNQLAAPLEKDSTYLFSAMIQLANTSSFGIHELGIYFLEAFPSNHEMQLFDREPDLVVSLSPEHSNSWSEWEELLGFYTAKGGENYVAMGYYTNEQNGIFSNPNFERERFSRCGPHGAHDCWDEIITYRDSLFARYMVDNVVLRKYDFKQALGAEIFAKNTPYHYYLAFDLGGDKSSNYILDEFKPLLFKAFHGLPFHHSIDLVLLHRNYQRIPFGGFVNQNQLQRSINRLRIRRRAGSTKINETLFLAALEDHPVATHQKYILVTDGQLPIAQLQHLLSSYSHRVDFFIVFVGPPSRFHTFKATLDSYPNSHVLFFRDTEQEEELFKNIWR